MGEQFEIEDSSNDKAYFTIIPNIILNHSSATDQALYLQMKRFAGEKRGGSFCTASEKTLMARLHIGRDALKKSLSYLLSRGWITFAGEKTAWTEGGPQKVKTYRVNDIWKINVEHYKGVADSAHLHEGVAETDKGVSKTEQGVAETAPIKNYRTIETSVAFAPRFGGEDSPPEKKKPTTGNYTKKYRELCDWMETLNGVKFVDRRGQYKALKLAREASISTERLKARAEEFQNSGKYEKDGMDWFTVVYSFNKRA